MGGQKKQTQQAAQTTIGNANSQEQLNANNLQQQLQTINAPVSNSIYGPGGSNQPALTGAQNLAVTGGYDPAQVDKLRGAAAGASATGNYDPTQVDKLNAGFDSLGSDTGYGREGYQNFADTGGYTDPQKQQFIQSAIAPTQAVYANTRDQLDRRTALQGGYSPGFDTSQAKLTRQEGTDLGTANLNAQTNLNSQINQNKLAGLGGLASTQQSINANKAGGLQSEATLAGNIAGAKTTGTEQAINLENNLASGKQAGQDALQKYNDSGVSALNQNDVLQLQNRAQSGNLSVADAQLLAQLASQDKTMYDNIMQGISTVGGAIGGIAGAFTK